VLRWDQAVLTEVAAALTQARAGQPGTLLVEGEPGIGKSSLLNEIMSRGSDFTHLLAEGVETAATTPYALLAQLDVDAGSGDLPMTLTSAGQKLRQVLDRHAERGPVLLVVDDLQWADPESVDTLVDVIGRATGDALLLVVGSRELDPDQLPRWRRWISRPGRVRSIHLSGLSLANAIESVRDLRPATSTDLARALWEHTAGHPLYLRELISEYDGAELATMGVLPAPAEFARTVTARLSRVSPAARELAQTLGVLGTGWTNLRYVAVVADVADPGPPIQELLEVGLAVVRSNTSGDLVRPAHAVMRSAIYQSTSIVARRRLHSRAAERAANPSAALEHRVAAAGQYDDDLAADLETHALTLHEHRAYRQAAHYLNAASTVTSGIAERQRRWLESLFETMLAGDRTIVRNAVADVEQATDEVRRDLVLGMLAIWEQRPFEGLEILTPWAGGKVDGDLRTSYRIEALLAWGGMHAGVPEAEIGDALRRAAEVGVEDPALRRLARIVAGQLAGRHVDDIDQLPGLGDLPANPAAVPADRTELLAWRGTVRSAAGQFNLAITDLTEATDRIQRGLHEVGGGTFHAMLGYAHWFRGNWPMARLNFRIAVDFGSEVPHPVVRSMLPLVAIGEGRLDDADEALDVARRTVQRTPWHEAVNALTTSEIVRRHAAERPTQGLDYTPIRSAVRETREGTTRRPVIWHAHAALAATWFGELDDAGWNLARVAAVPVDWAPGISDWLSGLIAEAAGDRHTALTHLRDATMSDLTELPLYRAHAHVDHARLALLLGDPAASSRSLELAGDLYRNLGAATYLERVNALRAESTTNDAVRYGLSDRERDVVTLLTSGMSYVQIARALFITRSTVSYHLVNTYAKTNVTSRHELTQLAHDNPAAFGLTAQRA
jgi:DNA-binding CsgD family transcriptional regulator